MFDSATPKPPPPHPAGRFLSTPAIRAAHLAQAAGEGHRVLLPAADATLSLMAGRFAISQLRAGLILHCTDVEHLHDMEVRFPTQETGIKVMLKLEGNARVSFGGTALDLDAGQGRTAIPRGAVMRLSVPEEFERRSRAGTRERMVVLTMTPEWCEAGGLDPEHLGRHLAIRPWLPSTRAVAIAEQLVRPDAFGGQMRSLYQESRVLELIGEALSQTAGAESGTPTAPELRPAEYRRIVRLHGLLQSGALDGSGMAEIAREIGCNANTLQRHFRRVYGTSIFDYQRECRLQRAADALQQRGVSVAQAAEIAGYAAQANFSTAFRRRFGLTPKSVRSKL